MKNKKNSSDCVNKASKSIERSLSVSMRECLIKASSSSSHADSLTQVPPSASFATYANLEDNHRISFFSCVELHGKTKAFDSR